MAERSFRREVALMLHGFGDAPSPLPATVALVEAAARRQARAMAGAALRNAERRGRDAVGAEDVIFLLRGSEPRLRRTLAYLRLKGELAERGRRDPAAERALLERVAEFADEAAETSDDDRHRHRRLDEISEGRRRRSELVADSVSVDKYDAFHRARCASFARGRFGAQVDEFARWADAEGRFDALALRLLAHLAYETVAQIVDLAFLARRGRPGAGESFGAVGGEPLSPAHVREAVRRFLSPRIGVNGRFFRNVDGEPRDRFFCAR